MYQSFIGLEVHIHLLTRTKAFCSCASTFGDEPNTHICPVCMGYPGVLPSLNIEALRMGCVVARALNCRIPERTWFERKQYFYPDMPKNYQISQFASPLGQNGYMDLERNAPGSLGGSGTPIKKRVRIKECHLEEDAGKMIHTGTASLLDYNRAGVSLLEIVTEPDMETGEEAEIFIRQLRRLVRYLEVCDGNMEEGSLRADANVSINFPGQGLGKKVEIKNLNSSRFVRQGLNYEIARQGVLLDTGKEAIQETRLWNENRDQTEPMRTKENAQDYRYFPEPDLPVFAPDAAFLASVEASLLELPQERFRRFMADLGLSAENSDLLCEEKAQADYFEEALAQATKLNLDKKEAAVWIAHRINSDIRHIIRRKHIPVSEIGRLAISPRRLASLMALYVQGKIFEKNAKLAIETVITEDRDPEEIFRERGHSAAVDPQAIEKALQAVFEAEGPVIEDIRNPATPRKRRNSLIAYIVGRTLKLSDQPNARLVRERLDKIIDSPVNSEI